MFTHGRMARASRRREEQRTRPVPAGDEGIRRGWARWLLAVTVVVISHSAQAHGIVGNRVFPGTLAFDDPAVMDELIFAGRVGPQTSRRRCRCHGLPDRRVIHAAPDLNARFRDRERMD